MRPSISAILIMLLAPTASADGFWAHWGDNKAELSGYTLTMPRYRQKRQGQAVLIFVTEDFSDSARVKADPGKHPKSDVYPVLKLNSVRKFQTGIYDYSLMTSTFARTEFKNEEPWPVVKATFSSQEWCGQVYAQWIRRGTELAGTLHSYFDGEGDAQAALPMQTGGVLEESLPMLVRGLRGDWLAPGESRIVPFLPSLLRARLLHKPPAWGEATVRRSAGRSRVSTVLGSIDADTFTVEEKGGDTLTFVVEAAMPHRIVSWSSSSGESATLTGSARLPYWELHDAGQESYLKQLGLKPQP
jgi:hypothetical protein